MLVNDIFAKHPADKTAVIYKDQAMSYGELRQKIAACASFLQQQGVKKGDRVGLFTKNSPYFMIAYFATVKLGAIIVPFNFQLIAPEVAYIVKDTGMKLLLVQQPLELTKELAEISVENEVKQIVLTDIPLENQPDATLPEIDVNDPAAIIYTSGTTGRPKGATLSQSNIVCNTRDVVGPIDLIESDISLCVLPMYHCFGWIVSVCCNLRVGATIVIQDGFNLTDTLNLIEKHHINTMSGVPTMYQLFEKSVDADKLKHFRYFISGGAAMSHILHKNFALKFGQNVQEGYGLSEATPVTTVNPHERTKQASIGLTLPNVTVEIQDPEGNELKVGEVGEICVKGPNVMLGYWNRPEDTAHTLRNGWLHTEDLAYRDEEGYIFIVDRLKDMIISSGENVYPREIEEVLMKHEAIREAAVIGIPDKLRGQSISAFIVLEPGTEPDKRAIRKYLLANLAAYKVPKEFVFCEQLPRNNTGKILKTVLREQALNNMVNRRK